MSAGNIGMIPFNLLSGNVTLQAYDPITGFFDDNVAAPFIADPLGQRTVVDVDFQPDITTQLHPLVIGNYAFDTVQAGSARHEYLINVHESQLGVNLNFGFSAQNALTCWLEDPAGGFVVRDSASSCEFVSSYYLSQLGTYTVTVTYGVSGGDGPFVVGVNYAPYPPSPYLCDAIPWDTLYASYSPYVTTAASSVASGDSVIVQAGTTIEFEPGGSTLGSGVLRGTGTAQNPIILKPATSQWPFLNAGAPRISEAHFPGSEAD